MAGTQVVFSFRKGLQRHYALALGLTNRRLVVLPSGETTPLVVDAESKGKYSSVCSLTNKGSGLSLTFQNPKHRRSVGVGRDTVPEADGFDQYPFASRAGPTLFALACGLELWPLSEVVGHLMTLAEAEEGRDDLSGTELMLVDAYRVGLGNQIGEVALVPRERQTWLAALAASANNQHDVALELCRNLPDHSYPQRNALVIAATQAGAERIGIRDKLIEAVDVSTFAGEAIAHCLAGQSIDRPTLRTGAAAIGTLIADPIARQEAAFSLKGVDPRPLPLPGASVLEQFDPYRMASALLDHSRGTPTGLDLSAEMIGALSLAAIDDLIDRGMFEGPGRQAYLESSRPADCGYLKLRLDPGSATDAQLSGPDGDTEKSRRHVADCLAGRAEPDSVPAATMLALRSGSPVSSDAIDPLPVELRATARELSDFLTDGDLSLAEQLANDPTVLPVIAKRLAPEPQTLPRTGRLADLRAKGHLEDALQELLDAHWIEALVPAKEVLGCTTREDLRDEALNLLACAQWQLGDDERAISALLEALEDEYNISLQTNIGVVAANLEPDTAAEHLGRLSSEAPTVKLKFAAAIRAINLWSESQDEDNDSPFPDLLRDAIRSLALSTAGSADLLDTEFWLLLNALAAHDSKWLEENMRPPTPQSGSGGLGAPRVETPASSTRSQMVRVALARAENPFEYVKAVGDLSASDSSWCADQRESLIDLVLSFQTHDPTSQFAAVMGMALLETDIAVPAVKGVRVRCFTVIGVCRSLDEGNEPADQIVDHFFEAQSMLSSCSTEELLDLRALLGFAGTALLASVVESRAPHLDKIAEVVNDMLSTLQYVPRRRLDMNAIREGVQPMQEMCRDTVRDVNRLKPHSDNEALQEFADSVVEFAETLLSTIDGQLR